VAATARAESWGAELGSKPVLPAAASRLLMLDTGSVAGESFHFPASGDNLWLGLGHFIPYDRAYP
jgi:hypothetical protein